MADPQEARPSTRLLEVGLGMAAAGVGTALGMAAERFVLTRGLRRTGGDGRGGPSLGSVHGRRRVVRSDDGVRLNVEVDEARSSAPPGRPLPTIVFTHGYTHTLDFWHYQRLALRGRYRLVLWDQRGHGRSERGPVGSSTIDQVGADLAAVIDAVVPSGPLVLVGHSMGGMTVMSLAARRPELFADRVSGVALISTSAGSEHGPELDLGLGGVGRAALRLAPGAARVLARAPGLATQGRRLGSDLESLVVRRYAFASSVPPEVLDFVDRMVAGTKVEVIGDFLPAFARHDKREALSVLRKERVLVLTGDRDLMIPATHSEQIAQLLSGAELVVVRPAGHLVPLERPDEVLQALERLLERAT